MKLKRNNFRCSHRALGYCRRTLEECSRECKEYGNCGECKSYYIPYSQEPCSRCVFCKVQGPENEEEGEEQE
ncbi:hypothetical protein IMSAGC002_02784 [Lachnospiraceae bacterium]|uniref:Uncharacterized protein n=1 Tax=Parablautia intestinalis TaxID=2320100 RepID=A0A3A9AWZ5_9FIRM|nr:hypothetical protein [Parablautia intestinalis]RKI92093.1 hypothetical protein D7V94_08485 [Parablautia intestinalis]GFH91527.1 hypothetical protein IMSAGC002_02784 [Lachnospiraceae bacterium]